MAPSPAVLSSALLLATFEIVPVCHAMRSKGPGTDDADTYIIGDRASLAASVYVTTVPPIAAVEVPRKVSSPSASATTTANAATAAAADVVTAGAAAAAAVPIAAAEAATMARSRVGSLVESLRLSAATSALHTATVAGKFWGYASRGSRGRLVLVLAFCAMFVGLGASCVVCGLSFCRSPRGSDGKIRRPRTNDFFLWAGDDASACFSRQIPAMKRKAAAVMASHGFRRGTGNWPDGDVIVPNMADPAAAAAVADTRKENCVAGGGYPRCTFFDGVSAANCDGEVKHYDVGAH
eukprot:TRINITY_DN22241_c0_g2_i1.p1 TRINITY_DN22241_c0_g2~~TRINITY_DN22241_c0_g2_i1.p1  ORF type:complete len:294 (-),score=51.19 TRINITY_DN22241_c0_g2_i1:151-1032(-)